MKYFGTDGIRGKVGGEVLNDEFVRRTGFGVAAFLRKHNQAKPITVVIGRDTRASGEHIENLLCEGLCQAHIHVVRLGVVPTPGVPMSLRDLHADMGVAITASHNPALDNGLKFFDNRGLKFSERAEFEIEHFIDEVSIDDVETCPPCGHDYDGCAFYVNVMRSLMHQGCLKGWKVVIDTANGATASSTPAVFQHFGAEIIQLGGGPDGHNINEGVGSEHPEKLGAAVKAHSADLGIAHDGDGDRLVVCDETGHVVHGDQLLGVLGLYGIQSGRLRNKTVVATIHSNLGLDRAILSAGGKVERVAVGDRNVMQRLLEGDYNFGGESSGHLIFRDFSVAGDGLLGAIQLVAMLLDTKRKLSELTAAVPLFPQVTRNIMVAEKLPLVECRRLSEAIAKLDTELAGKGRILVRYSGTESKLRLLAEAEQTDIAQSAIDQLETAARADLEVSV